MYPRSQTTAFQTLRVVAFLSVVLLFTSCSDDDPVIVPQEQKVEITALEPSVASVGDTVAIIGKNFSSVTSANSVLLSNDQQVTVLSASSTRLTFVVPFGAESGAVTVRIGEQQTRSSNEIVILQPGLAIVGLIRGMPSSTPRATVGDTVDIYLRSDIALPLDTTLYHVSLEQKQLHIVRVLPNESRIRVSIPDGCSSGPIHVQVDGVEAVSKEILTIYTSFFPTKNCKIEVENIELIIRDVYKTTSKDGSEIHGDTVYTHNFTYSFDTRSYQENFAWSTYCYKRFIYNEYQFSDHWELNSTNNTANEMIIQFDTVTSAIQLLKFNSTINTGSDGIHAYRLSDKVGITLRSFQRSSSGNVYLYEAQGKAACGIVESLDLSNGFIPMSGAEYSTTNSLKTLIGFNCTDKTKIRVEMFE